MYCKIETRFNIYGIEYVKSVFRAVRFVFRDIFSLQIKILLCHQSNLKKLDASAMTEKKFGTKQKNRKGYFQS